MCSGKRARMKRASLLCTNHITRARKVSQIALHGPDFVAPRLTASIVLQLFSVPSLQIIGENLAASARIVGRLVSCDPPLSPRGHPNLQVLNIIIHTKTVANTPSALEDSAGHSILIQPSLLIHFHGDVSLPEKPSRLHRALL